MSNEEESGQPKSAWDEYTLGSMRLNRAELSVLFALAKVNFNGNLGKQFQHYHELYSREQHLLPKSQKTVFDMLLSNHSAYVNLVSSLRKSQRFSFLPGIDGLIKKIVCYQAVLAQETVVLSEDLSQIKQTIVRLGMLEEYDDYVIVYPQFHNLESKDLSSARKMEARAGDVFWKKHEQIYVAVLRRCVKNYFEMIGTDRAAVHLTDLLLLVLFVLVVVVPPAEAREYAVIADTVRSINSIIVPTLKELDELDASIPAGDRVNRLRRNIDLIKANLYDLSKKIHSEDRSGIKTIGGIQVVLTDSLKGFISKQSTTPPYFPAQKVVVGFSEVFSRRQQQEQLPVIMPDLYRLNNQSLMYAPFIIAYIISGSISCFMVPEPDKLFFWLRFHSTKTGVYRDDVKFSLGVTRTVVPYSENVVSTNRRSRESLITRKPEEIMSPFDIRVDNKDGILLLNVINKGHSPVYVYLFGPGDFVPGEFSDDQVAATLWKQIEKDNPLPAPSQEARRKLTELDVLVQEPVLEATSPTIVAVSGESSAGHPWRQRLDPTRLEFSAFRFPGMNLSQPMRAQQMAEIRQDLPIKVSHDAQREEFCAIIFLNDFLRNLAKNSNKNVPDKSLGVLFEKMHARKRLEELYPALCPRSKTDYLLKVSSDKNDA